MYTDPKVINEHELRTMVGDIDEAKVVEILKFNPTVADVEEAVLWAGGEGDILGKKGHPLTGIAAQVFDVLIADEDELSERR